MRTAMFLRSTARLPEFRSLISRGGVSLFLLDSVRRGLPCSISRPLMAHPRASAGSLLDEKSVQRKEMKLRLRQFPTEQMALEDVAIQEHLMNAQWYKSARRVCAYLSLPKLREVNTDKVISDLLQKGCALYVPRVLDSQSNMQMLRINGLDDVNLERNSMGILEPTTMLPSGQPREDVIGANEPLDLIVLPGLAFDWRGGRLGRGGGYYDKFLASYLAMAEQHRWKRPHLVALAYSPQLVDSPLPMDVSDVPVDAIVTRDGFRALSPQDTA